MAGPYAHITLLQELMRPGTYESIFQPSSGLAKALAHYFPYCALGAVSPDYPNLAPADSSAPLWADAMHYTQSCKKIISGIGRTKNSVGDVKNKQIAWLLGYSAHVVTDMTIHPVVQARVGVYAGNQRQHRICEMNQDSYIFHRLNLGEIGSSDIFADTVVTCSDTDNQYRLDSSIVELWEAMLNDVHPELFRTHRPDSALWHREFVTRFLENKTGTAHLFPLAEVISEKMNLAYPAFDSIDMQYIDDQLVPSIPPLHIGYDEIFDHAVDNVAAVWKQIESAFCCEDPACLPVFGDWNLDNGLDENGILVFW